MRLRTWLPLLTYLLTYLFCPHQSWRRFILIVGSASFGAGQEVHESPCTFPT